MTDAQKRKIFVYCEFMALQIYLRLKTIDDVKKDPKGVYRKIVEYYLAINHGIDADGHPLKPKETEPTSTDQANTDNQENDTQVDEETTQDGKAGKKKKTKAEEVPSTEEGSKDGE